MKRIITLLFVTATLGLTSLSAAKKEALTAYMFVYFTNNSPEGEQLRFAVSRDGFNWAPLNNGKKVVNVDNTARWKCIRDPHILRAEDGKTFYMVMTDMKCTEGWASNDGIVMMRSTDLVNWKQTAIDFPTVWPETFDRERLTRVWAPQTIYDREAKKYMIYYSLENEGKHLSIYYSYANKDFTKITKPESLYDPGESIIDADIIPTDSAYHMFLAGIWKVTAPTLKGPWTGFTKTRLQQTTMDAEGPGVFKFNNMDKYCLMYDCFRNGMYQFCSSTDLENFQLTAQTETSGHFTPRHGTVIGITEKELDRLMKAFPSDNLTKESLNAMAMPDGCRSWIADSNPIFKHVFTADPAPVVWGDTLWLFTGHDAKGGQNNYVMPDWCVFSTTDMKHWREYPRTLKATDFAWNGSKQAYAAHPVRRNGKYYLYISANWCGIGVAVADNPEGPYVDAIGKPLLTNKDCFDSKHSWACIDPAVFIDDDGQAWIFWGNRECYYAKLKDNMVEIDGPIQRVKLRTNGLDYTEAPWIHKHNGKYYLSYATGFPERLAYAVADNIEGPYRTQGLLAEIAGNSNTTHPGIVQFKGQWYLFTHDGSLQNGGTSYSRSVTVYRLNHNADGTIEKVQLDSKGIW